MKSEIWWDSDNFFNNSEAEAKTTGYKLKSSATCSNPEWKKTNGAVTVMISADFLDGSCSVADSQTADGSCGW